MIGIWTKMLVVKVVKSSQILWYCESSANTFPWLIGIKGEIIKGLKNDLQADMGKTVVEPELKVVLQRFGISL